ncbi:MAG: hypothetical protein WA081_04725 [Desulfosalsimonadaceae bacterium]
MTDNWEIYFFKLFSDAFNELIKEVESLAAKDPDGYKTNPKTKVTIQRNSR